MKKRIIILAITLFIGAVIYAAGTVTVSDTEPQNKGLHRTVLDWLSDGSGNVSGGTINITGYIMRISFIPDSGDTQPSDLYDLELQDADDIDLLDGAGANLSQSTSTTICPKISDSVPVVVGELKLVGSGCGAANGGQLVVYWLEP